MRNVLVHVIILQKHYKANYASQGHWHKKCSVKFQQGWDTLQLVLDCPLIALY